MGGRLNWTVANWKQWLWCDEPLHPSNRHDGLGTLTPSEGTLNTPGPCNFQVSFMSRPPPSLKVSIHSIGALPFPNGGVTSGARQNFKGREGTKGKLFPLLLRFLFIHYSDYSSFIFFYWFVLFYNFPLFLLSQLNVSFCLFFLVSVFHSLFPFTVCD